MSRAKILIVDDHPLVREGLAARLSMQPDMEVCGEAADVEEALALLESACPDLVIVDISLKHGHGLTLIKKIRERSTTVKMLVVSAHEESLFAERCMRAGAHGYVNKQEAQENVVEAIRTVLRGEHYLSPAVAQRLIGGAIDAKSGRSGIEGLSDRELQVFDLIGRGRSTQQIASDLGLSVHTIETHRENIRAKLSLRSGTELMQRAVLWVHQAS